MINYEIRRKIGLPLQENEKYLSNILDNFQMELSSPINKEIRRQKFNEFMELIKTYESSNRQSSNQTNLTNISNQQQTTEIQTIDPNNLSDIQKSLREQHKAFKSLIEIINHDLKDINLIKNDLYKQQKQQPLTNY